MNDPHFPDVLIWAIPFFILAIGAELLWLRYHPIKNAYTVKDGTTSIIMGLGMTLTDILFKGFNIALMFWFWRFRLFDLGHAWYIIILALIFGDFLFYWSHRFYHEIRWFWASHVVHHSSEHYNLTTALRQPWSNYFSGAILIYVPMVILGIHPLILFFVGALNLLYQFWFHTETIDKMPKWFEFIFNTPSHHRVHHARNPRYLDANYAGILILWDRLFGTFVPELEEEKPEYGLVTPLQTFNPIKVAFHEFAGIFKDATQKGLSLRQRILMIFAAPGTCFDNSKLTAKQIKAQFVRDNPKAAGMPGLPKSTISDTQAE